MKSLIIAILAIIAVTISTTSCVKLSEEVSIERIEQPAIEVDSIAVPSWIQSMNHHTFPTSEANV